MRPQRDHALGERLRGWVVLLCERARNRDMVLVRLVLVELETALDGLDRHLNRDDRLEQHLAPFVGDLVELPRRLRFEPSLELRAHPFAVALPGVSRTQSSQ